MEPLDTTQLFVTLGMALAVLLLAVPLAVLGLRCLDRLAPPSRAPRARWRVGESLGVMALMFAGLVAGALLPPGDGLFLLLASALILGSVCSLAALVARRAQPDGWAALGFPPGERSRAALAAFAAYLLCYPLVFGVGVLSARLAEAFGVQLPPQEVTTALLELDGARLVLALLLGTLVQPLLEELLFRGFLQPALVGLAGVGGGIVATSFCFALLHGLTAFAPIFVLSLVLGAVRQRTGRLDAAWAVHALHNGWMLILLFRFPEVVQSSS